MIDRPLRDIAENSLEPEGSRSHMEQAGVKLLLTFDPIPERREGYFRYMLGEFVPALEHLGLKMCEAWHTAYGEYPLRLTAFTAPDEASMVQVLESPAFCELESRLQEYVDNYHRRTVPIRQRFQF
jgi:hypothetical protein